MATTKKSFRQHMLRVALAIPPDRLHMETIDSEAPCGSAHCFLGWLSLDPWFCANTNDVSRQHDFSAMSPYAAVTELADRTGIPKPTLKKLFFFHGTERQVGALERNPHAISKRAVVNRMTKLVDDPTAQISDYHLSD